MWLQLVLPWGGVTPKIRPFFQIRHCTINVCVEVNGSAAQRLIIVAKQEKMLLTSCKSFTFKIRLWVRVSIALHGNLSQSYADDRNVNILLNNMTVVLVLLF